MQKTCLMLDALPCKKRLLTNVRVVFLFCVGGVTLTILFSLIGFHKEITAALSGEIPGSASVNEGCCE
jgi:hypothetical protein